MKESVGRYVGMLHRYARIHFGHAMEPLGLTEPMLPYLVRLYHDDGLSQEELAKFIHCDKATAARTVAQLEAAGLIRRSLDAEDRRIKRVHLTAKARRIKAQMKAVLAGWSKTLTKDFSKEERDRAADLLARMAENARKAVEEERR